MASLTIVVDGVEQRIPLEAASVTLGRGLESDVRLKDIKASRRHCQVVKTTKGYQCVDLSSGNGTYINGVQIKTQPLSPGDKITIGSTTILFEDAPRPAAVSKAATGKISPPGGAPPPAKPAAASKIATAKVQVAPTKRTTERVEAVKVGSQAGLKPASQPVSKSGSRLGKAVPRSSSVRQPRPPAEAPPRKSPVLVIAIVAVVVVSAAVGGYFAMGSHGKGDQIKEQIEQFTRKGDAARDQEQFETAIQEYRAALALCQGDLYKIRASELSKRISQIESRKAAGASSKPESKEGADKDGEFVARKTEIGEKRKLNSPGTADWGGALQDWTEFASRKSSGDAARAQAEIRLLQTKAQEEAASLKGKADALVKDNKSAEAVELLKRQIDRFAGTEAKADLDALLKQFDK
jgi:hypothetical protein